MRLRYILLTVALIIFIPAASWFLWTHPGLMESLRVGLKSITGEEEKAAPGAKQSMAAAEKEKPGKEEKDRKILYWKSSMDPTYVSKTPGKDAMGMDLVPVYAGEEGGGAPGEVRIDPVMVQDIGVTTMVVKPKRLTHDIRTIGRIAYDEQKMRRIAPKVGGWIEQQFVNYTGQVVERGQKLLEIYSPDLVSTQEEYLTTLNYYQRMKNSSVPGAAEGAESLLRAAETRLRYWDISDAQIAALRKKGKIARTMALYAPFKGIVVERNIPQGGFLQMGQSVYGIADLSTVWVMAEVYEYEAPWLQLGQDAEMTLAYQPGKSFHGKIVYVYPYLKNMTRTIQVRMEFTNTPDFEFKPDMWANVVIHSTIVREGLAIPIQAVLRTGKRNIALVALGEGKFAPRDLVLGAQAGDEFQVLDGLKEGERVVTSAEFLINSESSLRSAIGKMLMPEGDGEQQSSDMNMQEGEKQPKDSQPAREHQEGK